MDTKTLQPTMLPPDVKIAPEEVMSTIKCGCKSNNCITNSCGCHKIGVKCTEFCLCTDCLNCDGQSYEDVEEDKYTVIVEIDEDSDSTDD